MSHKRLSSERKRNYSTKLRREVGFAVVDSMLISLKLETTAISLENLEEPLIINAIYFIEDLNLSKSWHIILVVMIANRFIKNLRVSKGDTNFILNNKEKNISLTKNIIIGEYKDKKGKTKPIYRDIRFINSFKFLLLSLEKLVTNLDRDTCTNNGKYYNGKKLELLKRNCLYPYEYNDSSSGF